MRITYIFLEIIAYRTGYLGCHRLREDQSLLYSTINLLRGDLHPVGRSDPPAECGDGTPNGSSIKGGHATLRNLVYVREQTWSRLCNVLIWPTNLDSDRRPNPITLSISSTISVALSMSSSILTSSSHYTYSRSSSRRAGPQITWISVTYPFSGIQQAV